MPESRTPTSHTPSLSFQRKGLLKRLLEMVFEVECRISRAWASSAHKRLLFAQWRIPPAPAPEWFDHSIDLYYQWSRTNTSSWVDRGVFNSLSLKGGKVLELSCGDGFNAKYFYAGRSQEVISCDISPAAIHTAKAKNHAANIKFLLADIRTEMPDGQFSNVIWDAAIEYFTPEETSAIMSNIKQRLTPDGVLSGHSISEKQDGAKSSDQHEYEFKGMEDLKRFLTPYFKNVKVFETIEPTRHNLYFWASDDTIPFSANWPHCVSSNGTQSKP